MVWNTNSPQYLPVRWPPSPKSTRTTMLVNIIQHRALFQNTQKSSKIGCAAKKEQLYIRPLPTQASQLKQSLSSSCLFLSCFFPFAWWLCCLSLPWPVVWKKWTKDQGGCFLCEEEEEWSWASSSTSSFYFPWISDPSNSPESLFPSIVNSSIQPPSPQLVFFPIKSVLFQEVCEGSWWSELRSLTSMQKQSMI